MNIGMSELGLIGVVLMILFGAKGIKKKKSEETAEKRDNKPKVKMATNFQQANRTYSEETEAG